MSWLSRSTTWIPLWKVAQGRCKTLALMASDGVAMDGTSLLMAMVKSWNQQSCRSKDAQWELKAIKKINDYTVYIFWSYLEVSSCLAIWPSVKFERFKLKIGWFQWKRTWETQHQWGSPCLAPAVFHLGGTGDGDGGWISCVLFIAFQYFSWYLKILIKFLLMVIHMYSFTDIVELYSLESSKRADEGHNGSDLRNLFSSTS